MVKINIRELSHHLSKYLKEAKSGERIIVMERNKPIVEIIPHNENIIPPCWKKPVKRIKLKGGVSASETIIKMREEDWR